MRILITLIIIIVAEINLLGQNTLLPKDRFMSYGHNENWLKAVKKMDKTGQWKEIRQRFFTHENWNMQHDSIQYSPLIIVNGISLTIPDSANVQYNQEFLDLLNANSINQINVVDSLSDKWIFCKPFSGVLILSVDKRTGKKIFKLKPE